METRENNNDFQQFDKIEKFLLNEFSDHEKHEFEDELKQNKSLNEEVEQVRLMIKAIEKEGMLEKIGLFHENTIGKDGGPTFNISRMIPYLVAVFVYTPANLN